MSHRKMLLWAGLPFAAMLSLCSCIEDSIQPWLGPDSIMKRGLELGGDWNIVNDDFKDTYTVTLDKKKDQRSIDLQSYYIRVSPTEYRTWFNFVGVVHQVNDITFVQITNFSHYHGDVFSLANRPTVALWQIAYDQDNLIMWAPRISEEIVSTLKMMQDSNDKHLFIDSTENLQNAIEEWTRDYADIKDDIDMILPIALTRTGTEFRMPEEMRDLVPAVYESYLKSPGYRGDATDPEN